MSVAAEHIPPSLTPAFAERLSAELALASPSEIVAAAIDVIGRDRLALVSSFGTESAALLKVAADVDPSIPVIFLDTGWLFAETLRYRDALTRRLGLTDVRTITPSAHGLQQQDSDGQLWFTDPDACCGLRKVEPLQETLKNFDGWLNGRKRFQGGLRSALAVVELDGERLKFNPLANASEADIAGLYREADLPQHPLLAKGFASVGCMPCTSRTAAGEASRAGRWRDRGKTECGIHVAKPVQHSTRERE